MQDLDLLSAIHTYPIYKSCSLLSTMLDINLGNVFILVIMLFKSDHITDFRLLGQWTPNVQGRWDLLGWGSLKSSVCLFSLFKFLN